MPVIILAKVARRRGRYRRPTVISVATEHAGRVSAKKQKRSSQGRLSWDGRLWDPAGVLYERSVDELARTEALALLRDRNVQVAVAHASRPLRWIEHEGREAVWNQELAPNFHDQPNWRPPRDAPGQLPFHAELWTSGERRVLLLTDRD